jgi:hypothetical protein
MFLSILGRLLPGVAHIQSQALPYAQAWHAANQAALARDRADRRPLWVVLGDSLSQGLGAARFDGGWVGQFVVRFEQDGRTHDVINLSVTGARIRDVRTDQLRRLRSLDRTPALITVLIGSNDLIGRRSRTAPDEYAELLRELKRLSDLPIGDAGDAVEPREAEPREAEPLVVVAALPRRNRAALAIDAAIDDAVAPPDPAAGGGPALHDLEGRPRHAGRGLLPP